MSVISTLIEPNRVTRVFFNCRAVVPKTADLWRIEQAIERSIALPQANDDAQINATSKHSDYAEALRSDT
jgi:hypothetical protein